MSEKETQTEIAALRTGAITTRDDVKNAGTQAEKLAAMRAIDSAASTFYGLNINVENYPQLKATENFLNLQAQLEGTENRVAVSRNRYNDKVKVFNVKIRRIPTVIIANMFGYEKQSFFESQPGTENVPKVGGELISGFPLLPTRTNSLIQPFCTNKLIPECLLLLNIIGGFLYS